jgi:hypothetical protein
MQVYMNALHPGVIAQMRKLALDVARCRCGAVLFVIRHRDGSERLYDEQGREHIVYCAQLQARRLEDDDL